MEIKSIFTQTRRVS